MDNAAKELEKIVGLSGQCAMCDVNEHQAWLTRSQRDAYENLANRLKDDLAEMEVQRNRWRTAFYGLLIVSTIVIVTVLGGRP